MRKRRFLKEQIKQKTTNIRQIAGVMVGQIPDAQYASTQHHLEPGDRIVLYTDGIIEAINASGEFFGEDRFKAFIEAHEQLQADEFVDAFLEHLSNWSGKHSEEAAGDDLTLLVIELEKTEED